MPNSETIDISPRAILDGERLNYARWSRVCAGQVAEFEVPYVNNNKRGTRREIGYVISHQGDNPVVRLLPSGKRLVIRSGHVTVVEKSSAIIHLVEQGISGAKRQRYNDLLAEISEFYAEASDDQNHGEHLVPTVTMPLERDPLTLDNAEPQRNEQPLRPEDNASPLVRVQSDVQPNESPDPVPPIDTVTRDPPMQAPPQITPPTIPAETTPTPEPHVSTQPDTGPLRSARQAAQKPEGYYAKLNKGESVADYTACHMHAAECERLYGKDATLDAGLSEVTNMICRGAAVPQDFRKLSPRVIQEALPSFLF